VYAWWGRRDDGDLVADGGVADLDRLVVDNRLEGGVERLAREEQSADGQGDKGEAGNDEPLARVALRKHRARLLPEVGVRLCGRSLG